MSQGARGHRGGGSRAACTLLNDLICGKGMLVLFQFSSAGLKIPAVLSKMETQLDKMLKVESADEGVLVYCKKRTPSIYLPYCALPRRMRSLVLYVSVHMGSCPSHAVNELVVGRPLAGQGCCRCWMSSDHSCA